MMKLAAALLLLAYRPAAGQKPPPKCTRIQMIEGETHHNGSCQESHFQSTGRSTLIKQTVMQDQLALSTIAMLVMLHWYRLLLHR